MRAAELALKVTSQMFLRSWTRFASRPKKAFSVQFFSSVSLNVAECLEKPGGGFRGTRWRNQSNELESLEEYLVPRTEELK